ncbi:MAG TPA: hypothetical protein VKT53_04565 [Candidatus Acidoferrum sp.]|nr:hypothetical protein [Candidatus Acidoferrum sp.]
MKTAIRFMTAALVLGFVATVLTTAAPAPGKDHPAYLHALTDLRHARAHLQRPDGGELREQEKKAIHEIDAAIDEIKKAAIDDGKDLNDHPPVDLKMDWKGRLHRALELIDKAHHDVSEDEDNQYAQGLQQRAMMHIDKAHHHVEEAIHLVE